MIHEQITAYENAIFKALVGTPESMGCKTTQEALDMYITDLELKDKPMELLKNFIAMCTPSEFNELKDMDFEVFDKMIQDDTQDNQ